MLCLLKSPSLVLVATISLLSFLSLTRALSSFPIITRRAIILSIPLLPAASIAYETVDTQGDASLVSQGGVSPARPSPRDTQRDASLVSQGGVSPAPRITAKVRFNVRIARGDGTFATRDDDADPVYRSSLVFGLYGDNAPVSVEQFLSYIDPAQFTVPSFASSLFSTVTPEDGLLVGGKIKGLESTVFNNQR